VVLAVREPTGEDELFVVETELEPLPALLELARRVGRTVAGGPLDWTALPKTDLDAAALVIRQCWIGEVIRTDAMCPGPGCRERIDVSFSIGDYLQHHRPRRPRGVTGTPEGDWFTLTGTIVRFRIPTIADLLAATSDDRPVEALSGRCVDTPEISRALARRLDRALSALAPSLDDLLGGSCPGCGYEVAMRFDPLAWKSMRSLPRTDGRKRPSWRSRAAGADVTRRSSPTSGGWHEDPGSLSGQAGPAGRRAGGAAAASPGIRR
jgi:hypothetical protein